MIRSVLTAASLFAAPSCIAQSWEPTSAADPWGPHGSQMCSAPAGDPERFCMAVFCTEPGGPLAFGYSNAAHGGTGDWDVSVSVDRLSDWPMTLSMQPGFGHAVGVAALDPGRYPGLYQSIRAGSWLYLDLGPDELGLMLRRSDAEMARLEDVCAPVRPLETDEIEITLIGPRRSDGPPEVIAVLPPQDGSPPSAPAPTLTPQPAPVAGTSSDNATAAGPAIPSEPALNVGAAEWTGIPDDGEVVHGMRLCFPGTPGAPPDLCLNVGCYEGWREVSFLFEHGGLASEMWTGPEDFPVIVSDGADRAARLPLTVNPDAQTLIAAGLGADADLAGLLNVLDRDGPLRLDLPFARLVVTAGGSGPAVARLRSRCDVPATSPPEPAARQAAEAGGIVPLNLADAPLAITGGEVDRTLQALHGATIDAYLNATGGMPEEARYVIEAFPAGAVAFSQLCGGAGWFGPRGCMGYVHRQGDQAWIEVFDDTELPYGRTVALDMGSRSEGWPDILVDGGAVRWRFVDGEYRPIR